MIIRPNKEAVEEYFASPIISQSKLKVLPKGVDAYNNVASDTDAEVMFYEEKSYFILGQAAELKVQQGPEIFNETYHLSDCAKPGDKVLSIVQQVFDMQSRTKEPSEPFLLLDDASMSYDIKHAIEFHEYYPKWGMDTKIAKIIEQGKAYYNDLVNAYGKQILSLDECTIVNAVCDSWTQHPRTAKYFQETEGIDYIYQLPIYFTYMGCEFKALIDILEVNHINKTLKPIDLKTFGGYTINFPSSLRKFRYDFQGTFYCIATSQWKKQAHLSGVILYGDIADYTVLKPEFVVESTRLGQQGNPLVFECSDSLMNLSMFGRKIMATAQHWDDRNMLITEETQISDIYGIIDTIKLYKWHLENGFESDKIVKQYTDKGLPLQLNWEGVEVI